MAKAFAMAAVILVKAQTVFDDFHYRVFVINAGEFFCEPGVTTELATQLDPESFIAFRQGAGGTCRNTLPAFQASIIINDRTLFFSIHAKRVFLAGIDTGRTQRARLGACLRRTGADDPDVFYLRLGAGIRTIRQCDSKFMVKLQVAFNGLF